MNENEVKEVAENMFQVLKLFQNKMFRPFELAIKCDGGPMQFRILGMLKHRESISMSDIAHEMMVSKQQLTPVIDKMIEAKLVVRENDSRDRRIINISLDEAGREMLAERTREILGMLVERFKVISDEDVKMLGSSLEQIREVLVKL